MPKPSFEDHLHPIPKSGVPYAPAWDGNETSYCVAWMAYVPECDLLRARLENREFELLRAPAIGKPAVIRVARNAWEIAAPVWNQGTWTCRRFAVTPQGVAELAPLANPGAFIETVRLTRDGTGAALAAISREQKTGPCAMLLRTNGESVEPLFSTPPDLAAYRPTPVAFGKEPALVFDAWDGTAYRVYLQTQRDVVCLSAPSSNRWQLAPDAVAGNDGSLYVAWLRDTDVIDPRGVIDARCELLAARVTNHEEALRVHPIGMVEDLSHGLMDLSPNPRGVWGYCGRRRHPMLLRSSEGVTLLWEQKENHDGPTRENQGILWARQLSESGASTPKAVAENGLHYEIAGSHQVDSTPAVACYEGIFTDERQVVVRTLSTPVLDKDRFPRTNWRGWKPITLPLPQMNQDQRPAMTANGTNYSLYWLDLHCHTTLSGDAAGEVDVCYRTARFKAGIDGILVTDNDHYVVPLNHNEWQTNCELADAFNQPGRFLALIGYEWTCRRESAGQLAVDHRSVLLPEPTPDIVRWNEVKADTHKLYAFVRAANGFTHAHHQDWHLLGDPAEVNIEAASSWDAYLERNPDIYHNALHAGRRLGVIGGSDTHRRNPGLGGALTGVWAESLTRKHVLEALKNRRCFATTGHRVAVDFRVNGAPMGQVVKAGKATITFSVTAPAPITCIELVKNGFTIEKWDLNGARKGSGSYEDVPAAGTCFYYLKVALRGDVRSRQELPANLQQALGPRAWSSPVWLTPEHA